MDDNKLKAFSQFSKSFVEATPYYLVQSPLNGITQFIDHTAGTKLLPKVQLFDAPAPAKLGTPAYAGEVAAGAAATVIPMILLHKVIGPGAASKLELTSRYGLTRSASPSILKSAGLGAVYGSLLTPGDTGEHFYQSRLTNGLVSAVSLATLTSGSIGLKSSGSKLLRNDLVSAGIAGAVTGTVSADGHSLLRGQGLASNEDRLKSIISYSVGGIASGAANSAREALAPSSGIRGVRTLSDMTRRADSTMLANPPKRFASADSQNIPPKAEHLTEAHNRHWYNRSSSNLRAYIDESKMPLDWRKQLVSGHQDLTYGLEAVHNRSNPKPIIVVYGSARFSEKKNTGIWRNFSGRWKRMEQLALATESSTKSLITRKRFSEICVKGSAGFPYNFVCHHPEEILADLQNNKYCISLEREVVPSPFFCKQNAQFNQ